MGTNVYGDQLILIWHYCQSKGFFLEVVNYDHILSVILSLIVIFVLLNSNFEY